jgi:hypothetical protein
MVGAQFIQRAGQIYLQLGLSQTTSCERYIGRNAKLAGSGNVPAIPDHNNNSDPTSR